MALHIFLHFGAKFSIKYKYVDVLNVLLEIVAGWTMLCVLL